jgi:glycosyltransferase involved in cell wall biosynthesis
MEKPLISFIVISYNQERFIREAIEGAIAQSYSPLEIIIMDDCSTDRSHEIAQQIVAAYKGPHRVSAHRSPQNCGIGKNINRAVEMCSGELIVGAAGDDVSLPTRTSVIYEAWEKSGRRATSIFSSYTVVSEDGVVLGDGGRRCATTDNAQVQELTGSLCEFLTNKTPAVNGCTHAWSPALTNYFGPLNSDLEDLVLSFRTLAIGKMFYVDVPLVKYRRHGTNVSFLAEGNDTISFEHRERRLRWVDEKSEVAYANMVADVELLYQKGRITAGEHNQLQLEGRRMQSFYAMEKRMMDGDILRRLGTLVEMARRGDMRSVLRFAPRALPRKTYLVLYLLRERWHAATRAKSHYFKYLS